MSVLFGLGNSARIDVSGAGGWTTKKTFFFRFRPGHTLHDVGRVFAYASSIFIQHAPAGSYYDNAVWGGYGSTIPTYPIAAWDAPSILFEGTIHTLVVVYDLTLGSQNIALYVDTDPSPKGVQNSADAPAAGTVLFLGGDGAAQSLDARLYEVGIWTGVALTGAQAAQLGAGNVSGIPDPTHYYPLIDNANDLFGGVHGTIIGAASLDIQEGTNLYAPSGSLTKSLPETLSLSETLTRQASSPTEGVSVIVGHGIQLHSAAAIPSVFSFWPDSGMGIVKNGDGTLGFYAGAGGGGSGPETLDGDYNYGNGMIWRGNGTVDNLFANGINRPTITSFALNPDGGPSDVQWKGGGPVYKDPGTGLLIMLWHNEQPLGGGSYWCWLSLARSVNGGATWQECGAIIAPHHSHAEMAAAMISQGYGGPNYIANDGWGPFIVHGGYIYVYYSNNDAAITANGLRGFGWCVARAPLAEVLAAAASGTVSNWKKYTTGGWTEEGLYGTGEAVVCIDTEPAWWGPALAYNTYRDRFIALGVSLVSGSITADSPLTFNYKESVDGVTWENRLVVENLDGLALGSFGNFAYATFAGADGEQVNLGQSFYLLFKRFTDSSIWRFPVTLTGTGGTPAVPSVDVGPAFRGVGRGIFRGLG